MVENIEVRTLAGAEVYMMVDWARREGWNPGLYDAACFHAADPEVVETWKWRGVPVWEHDGIICTGETYKGAVKLTFARGAALQDPSGLFNASLEGNVRRAIDIHAGDKIDEKALKALLRAAVALNASARAARSRR